MKTDTALITETQELESIKLIGLKMDKPTRNENGQAGSDCGEHWQRFENGHYARQIPGKTGDEVYAVYFDYESDHTQNYHYFIGCPVSAETEVPAQLDSLTIPAGSYLKITAKGKMPDCVADSWREIWASKLPRGYRYDFEVYDQRSADWDNAEVDIYLS